MVQELSLTLFGQAPWGFRCSGGIEHNQQIIVTRISPGTIACKAGVRVGDVVSQLNESVVKGMSQKEFEAACSGRNTLRMVLSRVTEDITQLNDIDPQSDAAAFGNSKGRRMSAVARDVRSSAMNTGNVTIQGPVANAKFSTNQYNNPMGLYSNEEIVDVIATQSKHAGFSNQVNITNKSESQRNFSNSRALAAINEEDQRVHHKAKQSRSMKILGQMAEEQ